MFVSEALKRWDYKTKLSESNKRFVCLSTVKQGLCYFLCKQWVETAEMCLVCKELSSAGSPCWDAWGGNGARALPPGSVQLWISSWCWHGSIPIKETLPLAELQFLQSQSLFRGVRIFQRSVRPRVDAYGREAQRRNKSHHLAFRHCCRPLSNFLFPK